MGAADLPDTADRISQLKRVIPVISLGFLLTLAGTLVTAILVPFGVVSWAVPVLTLVLAAGCLFMVRSLNLRVRTLRRELRRSTPASGRAQAAETAGSSASSTAERGSRPAAAGPRSGVAPRSGPVHRSAAARRAGAALSAAADRRRTGTEASAAHQRQASADERETLDLSAVREAVAVATNSAEANAAETRKAPRDGAAIRPVGAGSPSKTPKASGSTAARQNVGAAGRASVTDTAASTATTVSRATNAADADRKPQERDAHAGESRTRREQVSDADAQDTGDADREAAGVTVQRAQQRPVLSLGAARVDAMAEKTANVERPGAKSRTAKRDDESASSTMTDPLAKRFAATGWNPSPVPKPTYVEAPVGERTQPQPAEPDATSFSLPPQSKEGLAEMFAEELGYRPELEDATQDAKTDVESPLAHGRAAIGGSRRGVGRIDDVLARRRA